MNQKSVNFSRKYRKTRMMENQPPSHLRKRTIFSAEVPKLPNIERSRAKLIQNLMNPQQQHPRDFAAYFHCKAKNTDPDYIITSHHTCAPLPIRKQVIPAFPCIQLLRWKPSTENSFIEDDPVVHESRRSMIMMQNINNFRSNEEQLEIKSLEQKFNCRCDSCDTKKCPSRGLPTADGNFKDNIMKFCDQYTMTPRLSDVGCGCTQVHSPKVSDVSVTASNIAVKDTQASIQIHRLYTSDKCPASILKKNEQSYVEFTSQAVPSREEYPDFHDYPNFIDSQNYATSHCCEHARRPIISCNQEPERDYEEDYCKPAKNNSFKSFFGFKKKSKEKENRNSRRIIYNEGISDKVAVHLPITPVRVPSPVSVAKVCSKTSTQSKCYVHDIPYSHKADSRYHHNCKKPYHSRCLYGDVTEKRHLVKSPDVFRKMYVSKPVKHYKAPIIQMPKKVLTSERDIENYIECYSNSSIMPPRRCHR